MRKRWIYLSAALLLLVGVCARKPVVSGAAPADPVDVSRDCILTVSPVDAGDPAKAGYLEDMKNTQITLELYKVASAEKVSGYDTYRFKPEDAYAGLGIKELGISDYSDLQQLTAADWKDLAQQAAEIALGKDSSEQPIASEKIEGVADATLSNEKEMQAGLYLLIARDMNPPKEGYVKTVMIKAEGEEDAQGKLVTIANSPRYEYQFEPQLIALPTKKADENGDISTANRSPWLYTQSVYLKSGREQRYARLEIAKTLQSYETVEGTLEPVTFVFQVVATLDDEKVYDNVTSLTFTGPGTKSTALENIPATAQVTVTEIYSGVSYTPVGNGLVILDSIPAEPENPRETNRASFENRYNNNRTHGSGILNQFTYDGRWDWQRDPQETGGQGGE